MKNAIASFFLFCLMGQAMAASSTTTFDIYDDTGEKQPHYLTMTYTNSKLSKVQLFADSGGKTILLFEIAAKKFKMEVNAQSLNAETRDLLHPTLRGSYSHPWGDSTIETAHRYSLGFNIKNDCPVFVEDEFKACRMEVSDYNAGESAMWGTLVKRK